MNQKNKKEVKTMKFKQRQLSKKILIILLFMVKRLRINKKIIMIQLIPLNKSKI